MVSLVGFTDMAEYSANSPTAPFASNGLTNENVNDLYNDDKKLDDFVRVPVGNLSYGWTVSPSAMYPLPNRNSTDGRPTNDAS